jgi:coenzyme F420-0:L-glutamate ligase/coenzyme F420-1:gamma-L-glutamate ligase
LNPVQDLRGQPDLFDRILRHTEINFADQLAGATSLLMGQADEGQPVVIARGLAYEPDETARAGDILRPKERDLFR